ncbi:hypothetical protein SLEP1_g34489 [Rubroshorea leprosula]|uniref:Uncharacterized protein n=1 Tax=Rubroshorea leprosula TaxID=152421 RepID=A0AAV5KK22_9ROSI|nr:hypothetical protein SLEP1_g34489 [Rubroshorea leprosula]
MTTNMSLVVCKANLRRNNPRHPHRPPLRQRRVLLSPTSWSSLPPQISLIHCPVRFHYPPLWPHTIHP